MHEYNEVYEFYHKQMAFYSNCSYLSKYILVYNSYPSSLQCCRLE